MKLVGATFLVLGPVQRTVTVTMEKCPRAGCGRIRMDYGDSVYGSTVSKTVCRSCRRTVVPEVSA